MADLAQLEARLAIALRTRAELEEQLTQPEVLADHTALARIGRELSRTAPLAETAAALSDARARQADAKGMELDPGADAEMRLLATAERAAVLQRVNRTMLCAVIPICSINVATAPSK